LSKTVDLERAQDAERARLDRAVVVLQELLAIVKCRKEQLPQTMHGARINRSLSTVKSREELLSELLELVGQHGARKPRRE
jgi:hypothetical protein